MKKSITAILTGIFALGIAFGASGCNDVPMPDEISSAGGTVVYYDDFEGFKTFYNRQFVKSNEERMYLLNPGDKMVPSVYMPRNFFYIEGESLNDYTFENPVVKENYSIFDEELGDCYEGALLAGTYPYSFHLKAEFYPMTKKVKPKNLSFEFDNSRNAYITVTITHEENTVGVCEFNTTLDITNEWFKEYILNNLI